MQCRHCRASGLDSRRHTYGSEKGATVRAILGAFGLVVVTGALYCALVLAGVVAAVAIIKAVWGAL